MGNSNTKSNLRNAIIYLNISAVPIELHDENFWNQIWSEDVSSAVEIIKSIRTQEIRMLRDGSSKNFATLTYKMVERLYLATNTLCNTQSQQTAVLNSCRILTRIIPCIFEDKSWCNFFIDNSITPIESGANVEPKILTFPEKKSDQRNYKSYLPQTKISSKSKHLPAQDSNNQEDKIREDLICIRPSTNDPSDLKFENFVLRESKISDNSLIKCLIYSICDLLFCPEFTVTSHTDNHTVDAPPEDLKSLLTCEYIWEPGVGFESNINSTTNYDKNRADLLRLLLVCFSETLYETPEGSIEFRNIWIELFVSNQNRHVLPLFTSLLNTIFVYKPYHKFLPLNSLLSRGTTREELVELSLQILIVVLDKQVEYSNEKNLFIEYLSRIHKNEDLSFLIRGFIRLLNSRLEQGYLISYTKDIKFEHELLILFWRVCNHNKKFTQVLLNSTNIIDIVIPILHHLNDNYQNSNKTALTHLGIFNLLILSGERNFGVKLNKPYIDETLTDLPSFTGTHADLMIIIFHKLIMYGYNLNQLFDFMLTILVNISPYMKSTSMLACKCLIQLFEVFSSPFVILTEPNYHQIVIFLLEIYNNLIQYQFDGNTSLIYTILQKKETFIKLANLPTTSQGIQKVLDKLIKKRQLTSIENSHQLERSGSFGSVDTSNGIESSKSGKVDYPFEIEATVSSDGTNSDSSDRITKKEVSLIATPDILHVIQPTHPFSKTSQSDFFFNDNQEAELQQFSFDDIINQATKTDVESSNSSEVSCRSTKSTDRPLIASESEDSVVAKVKEETAETNVSMATCERTKQWRASPEWAKEWKKSLPLSTTLRMIEVLAPQLNRLKSNSAGSISEAEAVKILRKNTLVGLLPVPHPILIRKYRTNNETTLWFRVCTWGILFVRNSLWADTSTNLIKIT